MILVLLALITFVGPLVVIAARHARSERAARTSHPHWPYRRAGGRVPVFATRPQLWALKRGLLIHGGHLGLIGILGLCGIWDLSEVGIEDAEHADGDVFIGALFYVVWMFCWFVVGWVRLASKCLPPRSTMYEAWRPSAARGRRAGAIRILSTGLAALTTGFWLMGILVYRVGVLTDAWQVGAAVGFGIMALLIWARTWQAFLGMILIYPMLVLLLYSPAGLLGATTFYMLVLIHPTLHVGRQLMPVVARVRSASSADALA